MRGYGKGNIWKAALVTGIILLVIGGVLAAVGMAVRNTKEKSTETVTVPKGYHYYDYWYGYSYDYPGVASNDEKISVSKDDTLEGRVTVSSGTIDYKVVLTYPTEQYGVSYDKTETLLERNSISDDTFETSIPQDGTVKFNFENDDTSASKEVGLQYEIYTSNPALSYTGISLLVVGFILIPIALIGMFVTRGMLMTRLRHPQYAEPHRIPPQILAAMRPSGITILAVLAVFGGICGIGAGIWLIWIGVYLAQMLGGIMGPHVAEVYYYFIIVGAFYLFLGPIDIVIGWGLWNLKWWARTVAIVFYIIGLCVNIVDIVFGEFFSIFSMIISIVVLVYLFTPRVKMAFSPEYRMTYLAPGLSGQPPIIPTPGYYLQPPIGAVQAQPIPSVIQQLPQSPEETGSRLRSRKNMIEAEIKGIDEELKKLQGKMPETQNLMQKRMLLETEMGGIIAKLDVTMKNLSSQKISFENELKAIDEQIRGLKEKIVFAQKQLEAKKLSREGFDAFKKKQIDEVERLNSRRTELNAMLLEINMEIREIEKTLPSATPMEQMPAPQQPILKQVAEGKQWLIEKIHNTQNNVGSVKQTATAKGDIYTVNWCNNTTGYLETLKKRVETAQDERETMSINNEVEKIIADLKSLSPTPTIPSKISKPTTVRCPKCGSTTEITSVERPLSIVCPKCGAKGVLK